MKIVLRIALLSLCVLFVCGPARAQYLNPKLAAKKISIRGAVILPPKVELTKQSVKGSEMMVAESEKLSKTIVDAVGQVLQKKKVRLLPSPFATEHQNVDDSRKYVLADIQGRYDALLPKLVRKSKDIKKERFSLGDQVMTLNVDKAADALVFIRAQGLVFTKGKAAFSLLNPLGGLPVFQITIGLVDAQSGEVLAFSKPIAVRNVSSNDEKFLNKLITKSLKKLPEAP